MADNRVSAVMQTASHVLVVGAGVVYVCGFVIVAAGTLFVFLLAFPMLLVFRMFSFFGLSVEDMPETKMQLPSKNRTVWLMRSISYLPMGALGLSYLFGFLFKTFPEWNGYGLLVFFVVVALITLLQVIARKWFASHLFVSTIVDVLSTVVLFGILFRYADRSLFWFVTWFTAVSASTLFVSSKIVEPDSIRKTEWERLEVIVLPAVIFMYSTKVYPTIRHEFGGGAPVSVTLHLSKKLPPFGSQDVTAALVDETERGFYLVGSSDKAVFVARGLVDAVEFLHSKRP